MLLLTSTSDLVRVVTGSAADIEVHASFVDNLSAVITPGRTNTASITTATTTTVVGSPAASTQRNVKHLNIRNNHASTSTTLEVLHTDGTNIESLWAGTLLAGEVVVLDANGNWQAYTSGGILKSSTFVGPVDVQVFAANGTWTKPTAFTPRAVFVKVWGAGGGGGAGASLATAVVAKGGAAGGGGAFTRTPRRVNLQITLRT